MSKKLLFVIILIGIIVGGYFYYASYHSGPSYFLKKSQAKYNITDYSNIAQISDYIAYLNSEKNSKNKKLKTAIEIEAGYYEVYLVNKKCADYIANIPNFLSVDCTNEEIISLKKESDNAKLKIKAIKKMLEDNKEILGHYYTDMQSPIKDIEINITQHNDILYIICPK